MPHGQPDPTPDSTPATTPASTPDPPDARDLLHEADQRLLQDVDALADAELTAPTALPGWTRAHVVAHLALNAEGLVRALDGVRKGRGVPVYASDAARSADIESRAAEDPAALRERLFAATSELRDELAGMTPDLESVRIERHPGGRSFAALEAVPMRWREVEIHHVDLAVGYWPSDWEPAFVDHLLRTAAFDRGAELDAVLRTPEGDVPLGSGDGPVLSGSAADLAWWLVRGGDVGLSGEVPTLGPWQRRPHPAPTPTATTDG